MKSRTNNLGTSVEISRNNEGKGNDIIVKVWISMSKQYLKYLTKKYLKKAQLRDYIRVIADEKQTYQLRYFRINEEASDDEKQAE